MIRLRIAVDEVLVSNAKVVPDVLYVPLASHLHYNLRQIQEAHSEDSEQRLILLKGDRFEGIKPGVFMRSLEDKDELFRLRGSGGQQVDPPGSAS